MWHSFVIVIGVDSLKVIIKEGRVFFLSFEEKELQDFIMWQVRTFDKAVIFSLYLLNGILFVYLTFPTFYCFMWQWLRDSLICVLGVTTPDLGLPELGPTHGLADHEHQHRDGRVRPGILRDCLLPYPGSPKQREVTQTCLHIIIATLHSFCLGLGFLFTVYMDNSPPLLFLPLSPPLSVGKFKTVNFSIVKIKKGMFGWILVCWCKRMIKTRQK